ncbi:TPA: recombinase family protein [Vibrio parahaemolyticus]|nr:MULTISPECIES: recombinase family protein [Vibrio]MDW1518341.1 recombinase family protein [Vibrio sp. Vb5032]TOG61193.1 recombinase family protein [Vibrio parahaemolyticus]HCG6531162.1 recombinase family protein [Vibrio parahaemolyticus]
MIISPKIYNYARVSTTKQLKGVGLETQQQRSVLEELAHKYELPIHDENFVDEGLSAYHGKHKDGTLGRVLSLIESGKISSGSILVVFSLDRLSRETVNIAMEQLLSIINRGVRVYTHIDDKMFDAASSNLTADLIVSLITMERANEESAVKSKRIIAAQKQALKGWKKDGKPRGALGRVPLWIDQTTNSFNEHAEGIKAAVDLFLEGRSTIKVKQHLDENYPFKRTRKTSIKKAQTWDYGVIDQLWRKTSLIGEKRLTIEGQEHVLSNYYPPLISLEKFNKLTRLKKPKLGRSTSTGSIHLLKGLARCGTCGSAMVFVDKAQHSKNYVCSLAVKGEPLHNREVFSAELLELLTLEVCRDQYLINSFNAQLDVEKKAKAEYELAEEKKQLEDLKSRYKQKSRASLLDLIEDTEDKIEVLEQQLASFKTFDLSDNLHLLNSDIFTEEVRTNFQHSSRAEIIDNLKSVLSDVTLNRVVEASEFTKTGTVNCVSITWRFKNDQTRSISVKPFRYIGTGSNKKLFVPVRYEYTVPVIEEENRRGEKFVPDMIKKLHEKKLLNKLYPSKGRYQWNKLEFLLGEFQTGLHNFLPNFVADPDPDAFWGDMVDKARAKGVRYTVLSKNVI